MELDEAFYTWATGQPGIVSLIGTRLYPVEIEPKPTYPCAAFTVGPAERQNTASGASDTVLGSLSIDCYAKSYREVKALVRTFVEAINGFSGSWGSIPIGFAEASDSGESFSIDTETFTRSVDVTLGYREV